MKKIPWGIIINGLVSFWCVAFGMHDVMMGEGRLKIIGGCFNLWLAYLNIGHLFDSIDRWKNRYKYEQPYWKFEMVFFGPRNTIVAPMLVQQLAGDAGGPYISMVMGFLPRKRKYGLTK